MPAKVVSRDQHPVSAGMLSGHIQSQSTLSQGRALQAWGPALLETWCLGPGTAWTQPLANPLDECTRSLCCL